MFDIGFSELLVIGLVALIVIGPERLPRVARTIGHLVGRLQRYVADVKSDIHREMELDELSKMRDSVQAAATNIESSVQSELSNAETELNAAAAMSAAAEVSPAQDAAPAIGEKRQPTGAASAATEASPAQDAAPAIEERRG